MVLAAEHGGHISTGAKGDGEGEGMLFLRPGPEEAHGTCRPTSQGEELAAWPYGLPQRHMAGPMWPAEVIINRKKENSREVVEDNVWSLPQLPSVLSLP